MRVFSSVFTYSSSPPNFLSDPQAVQKHAVNFHVGTAFPLSLLLMSSLSWVWPDDILSMHLRCVCLCVCVLMWKPEKDIRCPVLSLSTSSLEMGGLSQIPKLGW